METTPLEIKNTTVLEIGEDLSYLLAATSTCYEVLRQMAPQSNPVIERYIREIDDGILRGSRLAEKIAKYKKKWNNDEEAPQQRHVSTCLKAAVDYINVNWSGPISIDLHITNDSIAKIEYAGLVQIVVGACINSIESMDGQEEKDILIYLDQIFIDPYNDFGLDGGRRYCRISIIDHGYGMSKELIDRLFAPYVSEEDQEVRSCVGSSLYLTKKMLEKVGGRIILESMPNCGTAAHIFVPAQ